MNYQLRHAADPQQPSLRAEGEVRSMACSRLEQFIAATLDPDSTSTTPSLGSVSSASSSMPASLRLRPKKIQFP
jgi:hypothetical protein